MAMAAPELFDFHTAKTLPKGTAASARRAEGHLVLRHACEVGAQRHRYDRLLRIFIVTKGPLVTRGADLLRSIGRRNEISMHVFAHHD